MKIFPQNTSPTDKIFCYKRPVKLQMCCSWKMSQFCFGPYHLIKNWYLLSCFWKWYQFSALFSMSCMFDKSWHGRPYLATEYHDWDPLISNKQLTWFFVVIQTKENYLNFQLNIDKLVLVMSIPIGYFLFGSSFSNESYESYVCFLVDCPKF